MYFVGNLMYYVGESTYYVRISMYDAAKTESGTAPATSRFGTNEVLKMKNQALRRFVKNDVRKSYILYFAV